MDSTTAWSMNAQLLVVNRLLPRKVESVGHLDSTTAW